MILENRYHYPESFYQKSVETLETALNTVPAYSGWKAFDPGADTPINQRYDAMPELSKQMIRDNFP